jgi:EPS-associated MarR family transcriptional regulator
VPVRKSIDDDVHFRLLRLLEEHPEKTQRELSAAMGLSLGAVNYVLRALVEKGEVKIKNFRASNNKLRYAYLLTPRGFEAKARLTAGFLKRKYAEYEALKSEIEALEAGMADDDTCPRTKGTQ